MGDSQGYLSRGSIAKESLSELSREWSYGGADSDPILGGQQFTGPPLCFCGRILILTSSASPFVTEVVFDGFT